MQGKPKLRVWGGNVTKVPEAMGTSKIRTERHPICAGSEVAFAGQLQSLGRGHSRVGAARLGRRVLRGRRETCQALARELGRRGDRGGLGRGEWE